MGRGRIPAESCRFADLTEDYYRKAILWAYEQGSAKGVSETEFGPDIPLSTAHIATLLYRALGAGADGWFEEAGAWAEENGLLGSTGLTVARGVDCPRAAVVTFLYRALNEA